jgi:hypothetical protein
MEKIEYRVIAPEGAFCCPPEEMEICCPEWEKPPCCGPSKSESRKGPG